VLADGAPVDADGVIGLQNDVTSYRAVRLCQPLVAWLGPAGHLDLALVTDALAEWDYRYTLGSTAPTRFKTFTEVWQERVARERFPDAVIDLVRDAGGAATHLIEYDDDDLKVVQGRMAR
jgi:acyl-homoserine lactone acylase PvdQ